MSVRGDIEAGEHKKKIVGFYISSWFWERDGYNLTSPYLRKSRAKEFNGYANFQVRVPRFHKGENMGFLHWPFSICEILIDLDFINQMPRKSEPRIIIYPAPLLNQNEKNRSRS